LSGDPYDGWEGYVHPDAPAGGGGPGFFRSAHPAGMDLDQPSDAPHPDSPAARTSLVSAATGVEDAAKPPAFLETFKSGINDFSAEELDDALFTLFGELSSQLHDQLSQEARAIASTILNRHASIYESRKSLKVAQLERDKALLSRDSAGKVHDELARNPARYQKQLGVEKYKTDLASARVQYDEASKVLLQVQDRMQAASNARIMAHSWIDEKRRDAARVTLTDIVTAPAPGGHRQYEGFTSGKELYEDYPSMALPDKKRNYERWRVAKSALEQLAKDPSARDPYIEFRSHYNKKKALVSGRTRIGGNDFW